MRSHSAENVRTVDNKVLGDNQGKSPSLHGMDRGGGIIRSNLLRSRSGEQREICSPRPLTLSAFNLIQF